MKRFCLGIIAALMVGLFSLSAQDKAPIIVFDTQTKDFGNVTEGEMLKHVFRFANKGTATLEIIKVESS
jgi:hypothetical protein